MAPLAKAFIGSSILNPYFSRYESALSLAASKFVSTTASQEEQQRLQQSKNHKPHYTLVTTKNVSMTALMLFARDPGSIRDVKAAEVGFGAGDMANKGAVGLRVRYGKQGDAVGSDEKETELTFVGTHLQAMEWNLETRNRNWATIVSDLLFEDPKKIIRSPKPQRRGETDDSEETETLLGPEQTRNALHEISVYKPGSHLFVSGDLNYRISAESPKSDSAFPSLDPASPDYYPRFLSRDQLTAEKKAGRTLHGLSEAEITFPPTYKLKMLPRAVEEGEGQIGQIAEEEDEDQELQWKWASHRWPGWCDRVLYLDLPPWLKKDHSEGKEGLQVKAYNALPALRTSDHRPVFLRLDVPVLTPEELAPKPDAERSIGSGDEDGNMIDPRIKLPVEINVDSWEHRASRRQWEQAIGWSMLVSQSREAIAVFATVIVIGLGTWWYRGS
jgi:hypothetical protein